MWGGAVRGIAARWEREGVGTLPSEPFLLIYTLPFDISFIGLSKMVLKMK